MIEQLLTDLKLYGALDFYSNEYRDDMGISNILQGMLKTEKERRSANSLKRRLSSANFPLTREWEQIDDKCNPKIEFKKIKTFSQKKSGNLCLIGAPGLGKTHCLIAIGRELCRQGKSVQFYTACDLVNKLEEAKRNYELSKLMDKILKPSLLIIDELGFVPFTDNGARLLFDVFSKRYERGQIAVSTNLSFEKWGEIFGSVELTTALIDRFVHKCEIYTFKGKSVRLKESRESLKSAK